jgi:type II secretory pathway component PulF
MRAFKYRAQSAAGRAIEGTIRADDAAHAHHLLEKDGLIPVQITHASTFKAGPLLPFLGARVKSADLIVFTRQLGTMLGAGVPILQTLQVLRNQTESIPLKKCLQTVYDIVSGGSRLSEAMSEFPRVFFHQYISIVASGESGADLVEALSSLADWMEREQEVRTDVKSALRYPIIVLVALFAVAGLMVMFVVPRFAELFIRAKVPLPLPTRMLVQGHLILKHYWPLVLTVIALVTAGIVILLRISAVRLKVDQYKFTLRIFGPIYTKLIISRFARIFSMLVRNGVPVIKALDIAPGVVHNAYLSECAKGAKQSIENGSSVSDGFIHMPVLPPMVTSLIAIGEKTGTLDKMLDHVVAQYDMDVKYALKNLSTTIEPIITVIIGIGVLFLALALFLPIWNMSQVIK